MLGLFMYRSTYMNPMLTTNQKPTLDTQKLEKRKHKNITGEKHQTTGKRLKKKQKIS